MNANSRHTLLAALFAGAGLLAAGCSDSTQERVGQSVDQTTSRVAAATEAAADKATNAVGDAAITGKVKAAIFAEPGLKSLQIDVDTRDNVVTLSGNVASQDEKDRAMQVAQAVAGVTSVVDQLTIRTTG